MTTEKHNQIAVFVYDDANAIDVFGPVQVFHSANDMLDILGMKHRVRYKTVLLSAHKKSIQLSTGTEVVADSRMNQVGAKDIHTLLIAGGTGADSQVEDNKVITALKKIDRHTKRSASVCSGAFILAATGVLEGRSATTHWRRIADFQQQFPHVKLNRDALFTRDGKYACSAGVTAGIDMALQLVQEDHGRRVALETARQMVAFYHRPGGQNQFSSVSGNSPPLSKALQTAHDWIHAHLGSALDVTALADIANMSTRNFSRKFSAETGLSPARYIAQARLNQARIQLEESTASVNQIADKCGYSDAEIMRRLFIKELNVTPSEYRKRFSILAQH